jgi:hypothetical protein
MLVTPEERLEILNKYGTVDILVTNNSYRARFTGTHNFNKYGWSHNDRDGAIRGLYDAVQAAFSFACIGPGGDLDFDYDT